MAPPLNVAFAAGEFGPWRVDRIAAVVGESLPDARRVTVTEGATSPTGRYEWVLRGTTSNTRYTNRSEVKELAALQQGLMRPHATRAALIPIRKSDRWWALAQDERRAIFEEQSRHIAIGMEYLPPIARRLHHCRELGEPFDFLTWFEYAPEHATDFEDLVRRLRDTKEWSFVDREVDIRLSRELTAIRL
jgi:chlorite dismutase